MSKKPKLTAWSKKKPPMIGEYNASRARSESVLRWWNGKEWSAPYYSDDSSRFKRMKRRQISDSFDIEWRGLAEQPKNFVPPTPLGPL